MNLPIILAVSSTEPPGMLRIIFWILLIIWGLGNVFGDPANINIQRGTKVVLIILLAILGLYTFGF